MWPMDMALTYFITYYWFGWTNTFWFTLTTTGICGFTIEKGFNVVILPVFGFLTPLQELIWWVQLESRILLDFIPNNKHFAYMKQCNIAEMDWSPEIFILRENPLVSLISLYLGTCCCLCHLTKFFWKSINKSSSVQSQPLSSLYKFSLGCSSSYSVLAALLLWQIGWSTFHFWPLCFKLSFALVFFFH